MRLAATLTFQPWKQGNTYELGQEEALLRFGLKPVKEWGPLREALNTAVDVASDQETSAKDGGATNSSTLSRLH
ncbi:uncharacterized protein TRAVEDRAFT_50530 [Trametes versicolor FP-101664 SS1]|uniref:uncharacterized protein n=1 Tax=Trametes versicolor (strain FP-101664) TaxID=717944 RepID=UPI000462314D|nr:uncharacterized protein TRAVEDRAFT_50530 [Trametes versicolor FP-101664 SS1]EIW56040.1 hypothetical protein TRAVEDRAFT_50530 [Trametes versicolor FP-101664 SS1]